jgi:hypothetical protein
MVVAVSIGATTLSIQPAHSLSTPLVNVVSDDPVNNTPHVRNGTVYAIAEVGNRVVVGGSFTRVQKAGSSVTRTMPYLFAYNPTNGKIDRNFRPVLDGTVDTVAAAPGGNAVFVGGYFGTVNGANNRGITKLSLSDGSRVSEFKGKTNGAVHKIVVRGERVFLGGRFTKANDVDRFALASMDATTGALDTDFDLPVTESRKPSIQPKPLVEEMDATADGSRLVIVGNFMKVDGVEHQQVAVINLLNNTVMPWASRRTETFCGSSISHFFSDVELDQTGTYFVLVSRGGYSSNELCDTVTRWELDGQDTSALPTWINWTGGDTLWSVAVTPAAVYIGGHQRWLDNYGCNNEACPGSVPREGIAAVDPDDGSVLPWNPGRARGVGAQELVVTARGLYVGSDTQRLGGEYHARLGMFPSNG